MEFESGGVRNEKINGVDVIGEFVYMGLGREGYWHGVYRHEVGWEVEAGVCDEE